MVWKFMLRRTFVPIREQKILDSRCHRCQHSHTIFLVDVQICLHNLYYIPSMKKRQRFVRQEAPFLANDKTAVEVCRSLIAFHVRRQKVENTVASDQKEAIWIHFENSELHVLHIILLQFFTIIAVIVSCTIPVVTTTIIIFRQENRNGTLDETVNVEKAD